ncbi:MAG: diguanylate cyclase [Steroidobacteraceae bacterium]
MNGAMHNAWIRGWTVSGRLLLINGLLIVGLCVVSAIAWQALSAQSHAMNELAQISRAARYHQDAETLHANLKADVNALMVGSVFSADQRSELVDSLADDARDFRRDLMMLERVDLAADLVETETKVRTLADTFLSQAMELGQRALRDPQSVGPELSRFRDSVAALDGALQRQTAAFATHIVRANDEATLAESTAKKWLITAWVLTNVVVALLVAWLSRSIRRSLRAVRNVALALSRGDMTARNPVGNQDELGELAGSINGMADRLNDMIGQLRAEADRDAFGTQLVEALEMADTEEEAYAVLSRAMQLISHDLPTELLLADSSRTHLERATMHPSAKAPGCSVESPFSCMAVRRGNPVIFPDSEALNACSRLRGRPCGPVSAVCVPVSFMGRALGVLHSASPHGQGANPRQVAQLTTLGIQAGARIGTVRAFNSTQRKASTDSLTGLPNRRAAEDCARDLMAAHTPFAVALLDLDHFKRLNDTRGHEAGDQALRLFANTLMAGLRNGDVGARWGGEEFVLILPTANATQAVEVVDRIRARLATALLTGGSPSFTVSAGIADTTMTPRFEQLMRISDEALYSAKDTGRDRVIVGTVQQANEGRTRHATEHPAVPNLEMIANG